MENTEIKTTNERTESVPESTPGKRILHLIEEELKLSSEFTAGLRSTYRKMRIKINEKSPPDVIRQFCDNRKKEIFDRIDARTNGDPMSRKEEMYEYEKEALRAVEYIVACI